MPRNEFAMTQGAARCMKLALLGCTALVAFGPQAMAQQAVVLDQVVIDGTAGDNDANSIVAVTTTAGSKMATDILDTPASVSVITAKDMQARGANTAEQVLRYTAGVATDFYGGDDRFDYYKIRGFDASVFRDGLPMQKAFGGIREDTFLYERVEVVKGGNSTVTGPTEPGGMVNYVTKLPRTMRFGEAYATVGSFNHTEAGVDFGDNLTADSTLSYRLTARVQKADKETDYSQDDAALLMGGLTWRPSDATSLSLVLDHMKRDGSTGSGYPLGTDYDRDVFFGEPDFNYLDNERNSASILFDHDFGGGLKLNANLRYSDEDRGFGYVYVGDDTYLPPAGQTPYIDRFYFASDGSAQKLLADANLQYDRNFGQLTSRTLVGLQYRDEQSDGKIWWAPAEGVPYGSGPIRTGGIDLDTLTPLQTTENDDQITSLYVQQELTYDRFIATIGLRNDWMDLSRNNSGTPSQADFSKTTARLGLTYKITPQVSTYFSYAESVLPAGLTVEPEEGEQYEIGVKYRPEGMNALFTAALYDLKKTNITRTDTTTTPPIPRTIGEIRARGVELEARAELTRALNLTASYSYTNTEITDRLSPNQGNQLGNVPTHLASVWVDYTLAGNDTRGDMNFGLGARYQGTSFGGDDNAQKYPAALIFDAAYSYDVTKNTSLTLNVTNLFDEKHEQAASGAITYNPGREIDLTLRRTW
ncbi:TonB-dependent siderophore receptor [Paracoccus shanxieyensis]|uniref:TonB-dependent siderophore receptor n=1 Tax=Paracoccus shanxieyensis TaxID=2675752 RepID=A0A6L6J081_9RHOB|nr:TonB-dependent siderophore receptor [Paracoccus shanxieyensis]MTH64244.1 TonB-dependent siderophore receptor [Paracoccus shanxieyensis]MTH87388.1 TonB-dependent siderophore receptor [Paracoccus shanxieyensis]